MPREPYKITDPDLPIAWEYVRRKLHIYPNWPRVGKNHIAKKEFIEMAKESFVLQSWCDTWLSDAHWLRLKRAVWAQKKRTKDRDKVVLKNDFQLNKRAKAILRKEAKKNKISLSELILRTFPQEDID